MKKKQLRKRLLICLAGLLFSLSVISRDTEPGYDFIVNGIYYMILSSESKTVAVSYKTEVDPDYGPNYYVSGYSGNVTIPSNVTYNSITYKVTEIGSHAFDDSSIISVSIPNTVEAIGTQAFVDCADLQSIIVPNSVKSIGNYAFYGCTSLRSVTLSNQLTVLPNFLFKDCRSLSSIIIPQSVVDIGKNAFSGCTSLTDIAISNTVTTIEDLAFEGCSKLQSITIPGSVKNIGSAIFFGCSSLISITVDNNPYIDSRDNCNAIVNTSTNVLITGCRNSTIPNSVTGIGEKAFYGCEGFQSIIIPDNIISIGAYSFANCQLQDVTIGKSVRNIGNYAFGYVYKTDQVYGTDNSFNYTEEPKFTASSLSLKNVTSKIQEPFAISAEVFSGFFTYERGEWRSEGQDMGNGEIYYGEPSYYQEQISQTVFPAASLTVPSGTIDKYAALDAWNKFSLIIESGYTDGYIFNKEVSGIKMTFQILSIEDKTLQIGNGKEPSIPTETSASISLPSEIHLNGSTYNVVSIADSAFYNCKNLTSIEIPASITKSGNNSFLGCSGLQKIIVPDLKAWCSVSFNNKYSNPLYYAKHFYKDANTKITDLVIPDGVKSIGYYAFVKGSFNTVTIPGSVAQVGGSSFYKCLSLSSVTLADGVGYIRSNAFYGCTALRSVSLPETVYRLGGSAFYGCTALESIVLPSGLVGSGNLTGVGNTAFKLCSNLREVTSNTLTPSALGTESFEGVASDCRLYIPVGKMTAYYKVGWTRDIFGGGIVEVGDVVENFCIENDVTADFMKNVTYPDDDYSYTKITDYTIQATSYRKDLPMPVTLEVPQINEGESLILETYSDGLIVRSDTFRVGQRALEIWNLVPQTSYIYKLYSLDSDKTKKEVISGSFVTSGQVRMMKIDNMNNFRDIGGWKLSNGQHVKYDKIFRSAELATTSQMINQAGINELLNVQHVQVEVDFADPTYSAVSPISDYVEHVHGEDYQLTFYADGMKTRKTQYKNCFEKVVNSLRDGKKVLFHCNAGADRTGGFAFLLEGLLGVSESDLAKDYELTSFKYDTRYRSNNNYKGMVDYIKATFEGNTLNEKIEQMALTSFGISQKDIDDFRGLMSECNTLSATDVHIAKGKTAKLTVNMENKSEITAFQFYVEVPKGVSVINTVLGSRKSSSHIVKYQKEDEGLYKVVGVSTLLESFSGNEGILLNLTLSANESLDTGDYYVNIKDIILISPTETKFYPENTGAVLKVLDKLSGDTNGDGIIDVADIVSMVNYIMGNPSVSFDADVADLNEDGEVDIFDVMLAINLVMSQKASVRTMTRALTIDVEQAYIMSIGNSIMLGINSPDKYSAFQFDVEVAEGNELSDVILNSDTNKHSVRYVKNGKDTYRVIGISMNNSTLTANGTDLVGLKFSNRGDVHIKDIVFVTPNEEKLHFAGVNAEITGIGSIANKQADRIFDLSGRKIDTDRSKLPKGVYIINNKKVVIK